MSSTSLVRRIPQAMQIAWNVIAEKQVTPNQAEILSAVMPTVRGDLPKRGTRELLEAYSDMPWLRAVNSKISNAVATTGWRMYAVNGTNGNGRSFARDIRLQRSMNREDRLSMLKEYQKQERLMEVTDHPGLRLLYDANSFHTGYNARRLLQVYMDLVGEFFILLERDRTLNIPIAFWPIPSHWVMELPVPDRPSYMISFENSGRQVPIPMSEIIWAVDPDPENPYGRGSSLSKTLADELDTHEYASKHMKAHFFNRARPDFIAYVKPKRNEDEVGLSTLKRIQREWLNEHMGFFKAFKPRFINRELDIHEFQQDFRKQQLIPILEYERNTIVQVFGLPPEVFGILESSNRATIAAAEFFFAKYAVLPRLEFLRDVFQRRLIPMYDDRIIIEFDNPIMEDKEHQLKVMEAAPAAPTVDEWREAMGLPPDEKGEGDAHMVPTTVAGSRTIISESTPPTEEE